MPASISAREPMLGRQNIDAFICFLSRSAFVAFRKLWDDGHLRRAVCDHNMPRLRVARRFSDSIVKQPIVIPGRDEVASPESIPPSISAAPWIPGSCSRAPGNDGNHLDMPPHSRGLFRPSYTQPCPSESRGRRESRMLGAPAASRPKKTRTRVSHHRSAGVIPAFPARLVLTAFFALSLVIGLSCHHPQRNAQALSPSQRQRRGVKTTRLRRPH